MMPVATSKPCFLQGIYTFEGKGLADPTPIDDALTYTVPHDREAQLVYFRAGNASDKLVTVVIMRDGEPMRYFPIGAQAAEHVPLRVVEDLLADTHLEVRIAAEGSGSIVLDIGLVEVA
jgi:hypothetical protein